MVWHAAVSSSTSLSSVLLPAAVTCRVYDLQFMDKIFEVEAHDSEVLCIEYSQTIDGKMTVAFRNLACLKSNCYLCTCMTL